VKNAKIDPYALHRAVLSLIKFRLTIPGGGEDPLEDGWSRDDAITAYIISKVVRGSSSSYRALADSSWPVSGEYAACSCSIKRTVLRDFSSPILFIRQVLF
jgi:hypothetical protein